jgi:hypothetical protein
MLLAIPAGLVAKVIDITIESVWTGRLEAEAKKFLYFPSEGIEAHAVERIFMRAFFRLREIFVGT